MDNLDPRLRAMVVEDDGENSSSEDGNKQVSGGSNVISDEQQRAHALLRAGADAPEDGKAVTAFLEDLDARLRLGSGETILELCTELVGVPFDEAGLTRALAELERLAALRNAKATLLRRRATDSGHTADVLVRTKAEDDFCEIRVAVVGNVDSGKSTLLGVLTRGRLDDGRGAARAMVFRHAHEAATGRTSSIAQDILGFTVDGAIVNYTDERGLPWPVIVAQSAKIVTFIDLAGHEKYLKTTLFGLTGHVPDFCMMSIGANMGVVGMTKEHMGIALALKVPVFVVVTKIDMAPENILKQTLRQLGKLIKSPGARKVPIIVKTIDDVVVAARSFMCHRICPIFLVSNVTGESLDLLRSFLNLLPAKSDWDELTSRPAEIQIDDNFAVAGVGTVVSGTVMAGVVSAGDTLMLGPNQFNAFEPVVIKSIELKRRGVRSVHAGHTAAFALKKIKRTDIRKGMRLVHESLHPRATWDFEAEVLVLYHATTIAKAYEAVVHCATTRQAAKIIAIHKPSRLVMSAEGDLADAGDALSIPTEPEPEHPVAAADASASAAASAPAASAASGTDASSGPADGSGAPSEHVLRTGMKANVVFRFLYSPQFVVPGARLIFRDGRTKGVGKITRVLPDGYDDGTGAAGRAVATAASSKR